MNTIRRKIIWLLQFGTLRFVQMLLQCFPIDTNLRTARLAGTILYWLDRRHRRVAMENLRASFPGAEERTLRRMATYWPPTAPASS